MAKMACIKDFEDYAENSLDPETAAFISQGSEREVTLHENLLSYTKYVFIPRVLRNSSVRDLSVTVLGEKLSIPIAISPMAMPPQFTQKGWEIAAARAASDVGTVYTHGALSPTSLEDLARNHPKTSPTWMQMCILKSRAVTQEIIKGTEAHGFKAIVISVDMPVVGRKKEFQIPAIFDDIPTVKNALNRLKASERREDSKTYCTQIEDSSVWEDVTWIKSITNLPIVLKGILSVPDAVEAAQRGASAVWVSNHGGRQLDGVPAALDVLPEISRALEGSGVEVYADGGVRWGSDVFKLLALGARAVFIGRPILWGLAHSGQNGARSVLEILKKELDITMHLSGCRCINDIRPELLKKRVSCNCKDIL